MSDTFNTPEGEKKAKRPRIGATPTSETNAEQHHFERVQYQPRATYQRQEGYQPRRQYGNFQSNEQNNGEDHENVTNGETGENTGFQPRQNYHRQGGFQPRQGGYQPRNNGQGGYRPYNREGYQQRENRQDGYRPQNREGYQPRGNQQGGYRQQNRDGFQPRNNGQGGYRPQNREGYQPRGNQQGGYRPYNREGYQQRDNQQGGYRPYNREGGYQQRPQNRFNRQGGYRQQNGGFFPSRGKSFVARPKRIEYEMPVPDPNEQIRLNKFMSNSGICSRREADEFIQQGLVKVNGQVVTELGTKITHNDVVEYDEKVVALESKCYILLNKPKDCVTTSDDPQDRLTVLDLVKGACNERIYPVGRLDRNTTGVLLLTNDGDLASKLTHPKYVKKKIYHVWCDRDIAEEDMQKIADGIELEDGPVQVDAISYATETDRNQAGIEIHSGRNRIVRRIFESLGYHVTKLDRVYFAGLTKKNLPRGRWRYLTQEEVNLLKMGAFE